MENYYIFFVLLYAIFIGIYNVFKKKATGKSKESVILVMFSFTCAILSLIWIPFGIAIPLKYIGILAVKGLLLSFSWYCVLKVLKTADISIVSLTTIVSSVLTFCIGIFVFGESIKWIQIIGAILIIGGAVFINLVNKKSSGKTNLKQILMLLLSAIITSISGTIDKVTTTELETYQIHFWYLLFVFIFSSMFFTIECIKEKKFLITKSDLKNYWIYLVGIFLFVGDILLFLAYKSPNSQMIIISVLAKFKTVISVVLGMIIFKERNCWKKILISLVMFIGILLVSI